MTGGALVVVYTILDAYASVLPSYLCVVYASRTFLYFVFFFFLFLFFILVSLISTRDAVTLIVCYDR